ncbi:MAG TPA: polyheme membrane-associated cytochrome C, partial [Afifellaceae bacterium]|nr:polyheme membrane-associated cytochrome C [Afifellaceae bacterium]
CADCHQQHTVKVKVDECGSCHKTPAVKEKEDMLKIRKSKADFDGDGNVKEGIAEEIGTLHETLLKAIQTYGAEVAKTPIGYESHSYPYFFVDADGDGKISGSEATRQGRYGSWTPRLLRAAYNYQYVAADPGVYTHNPAYVIQLLHDSIEDLSSRVTVEKAPGQRPG